MRLEPREHRAGRAQARQRALSAREAELGGRGPRGAVCTLPCSSVTSLQYPAAVVFSEPTIAKALIWARKVITNKICDTFLISKCHPCDKYLQNTKLYLLCLRYWRVSMEMSHCVSKRRLFRKVAELRQVPNTQITVQAQVRRKGRESSGRRIYSFS